MWVKPRLSLISAGVPARRIECFYPPILIVRILPVLLIMDNILPKDSTIVKKREYPSPPET